VATTRLLNDNLPVLKEYGIAALNWRIVKGKSNTIYNGWDSWKKAYAAEPRGLVPRALFLAAGAPFSNADLIGQITGREK